MMSKTRCSIVFDREFLEGYRLFYLQNVLQTVHHIYIAFYSQISFWWHNEGKVPQSTSVFDTIGESGGNRIASAVIPARKYVSVLVKVVLVRKTLPESWIWEDIPNCRFVIFE